MLKVTTLPFTNSASLTTTNSNSNNYCSPNVYRSLLTVIISMWIVNGGIFLAILIYFIVKSL